MGPKKIDDSLQPSAPLRGAKKIEKIKITRKKEHSPLINKPSSQEPDPPSALAASPPQEPDPPSASAAPPTEESMSIKDKLLTLLESKDEDYIIDFIYECMLKMKEREDEIKESDPQMWSLIMELKEMMDP